MWERKLRDDLEECLWDGFPAPEATVKTKACSDQLVPLIAAVRNRQVAKQDSNARLLARLSKVSQGVSRVLSSFDRLVTNGNADIDRITVANKGTPSDRDALSASIARVRQDLRGVDKSVRKAMSNLDVGRGRPRLEIRRLFVADVLRVLRSLGARRSVERPVLRVVLPESGFGKAPKDLDDLVRTAGKGIKRRKKWNHWMSQASLLPKGPRPKITEIKRGGQTFLLSDFIAPIVE